MRLMKSTACVFIAMELLEGQTLKQMMSGKPLPLETVIDFGVQIAGAIDAAHSKGIVHRDIKPANIFVMKQRRIKVLDFGLAKLTRRQLNSDETGMTDGTEPGMVMGTVGYMSPEQLRGQGVDGRTDIFAFGAILYEMLAGRRAFEKPTSVGDDGRHSERRAARNLGTCAEYSSRLWCE